MMIKHLNINDCYQSAALHATGMPEDFLASFGRQFLVELHKGLISHPSVIALGEFQNHRLLGIMIATTDTRKLLRQLFLTRFPIFVFPVLLNLIKRPINIKYIWETFFYGQVLSQIPAEILVLSIDAAYHQQGFATKLMLGLKAEFKKRDILQFKVATRSTNTPANKFYRKMGGQFQHQFHIYGQIWNLYKNYL